jgi:hypothetical protein
VYCNVNSKLLTKLINRAFVGERTAYCTINLCHGTLIMLKRNNLFSVHCRTLSACTRDHDNAVFLVLIIRLLIEEKVLQSKENNVGFEVDSVALGKLFLISSMLHVAFHSFISDYIR